MKKKKITKPKFTKKQLLNFADYVRDWQEYSVFKCERFNEEKKRWFEEYFFYWGDCKHIFDKNDWRFCEVKDKRKLAVYIGKGWFKFPIKFPVKLDNGIVINELEKP